MRRSLTWRALLALVLLFVIGAAGAWAVGETTGTVSACATIPEQTIAVNGNRVTTVAGTSSCNTVTYTVPTTTVHDTVTVTVSGTTTTTPTITTTPTSTSTTPTTTSSPPSAQQETMGDSTTGTGVDSGNGDIVEAQQATLAQSGTVRSLSFYVVIPAGELRLGIYADNNGSPGTLLATTAEITPLTGWNTAKATSVHLDAGTYWLAYFASSSSLTFGHSGGGVYNEHRATYGALPNPFGTVNGTGGTHWSLYATLDQDGSQQPTVTTATGTTTGNPPPSGGPTTQLAWFYGEPNDGTSVATIASRHKLLILSGHQVEDGYLQQLRSAGYTAPVTGYIDFPRAMGPSSCASNPSYSGFTTDWASWDGEFCTYLNPNESWFLHNGSGARISFNGGYLMNPANSGWQQYMVGKVGRYFTEFPGLAGIFLDDTWATATKPRGSGCVEAVCQSDASWHAAVMTDLQAIKQALGAHTLWMNSDDISQSGYGGVVDGWMWEDLGTGWCDGCWEDQSAITQHLADADAALAAGKQVLFVGQGDSKTSIQEMRFSHALYLMVAGPNVFYRFQNAGDYLSLWDYPEYGWDLGASLGGRYMDVGTVMRRDFVKGIALANIGTSVQTVQLAGSYITPAGATVASVTLQPHEGITLRAA